MGGDVAGWDCWGGGGLGGGGGHVGFVCMFAWGWRLCVDDLYVELDRVGYWRGVNFGVGTYDDE